MNLILRKIKGLSIDSTVGEILNQKKIQCSYADNLNKQTGYNSAPCVAIDAKMLPSSIRRIHQTEILYLEDLQAITSIPYLLNQKEETQISDLIIDEKDGFFLIPAALAPANRS